MKLTVLGKYGPYPKAGGATSGYLLKTNDKIVVLDMGSGTFSRLSEIIRPETIDALIVSHFHADHAADIPIFAYYLQNLENRGLFKGKIKMYCPFSDCALYKYISSFKYFDIINVSGGAINFGQTRLEFFEMKHPEKCFGVKVSDGERVFSYTGDTNECPSLRDLFAGADAVIADGGLLEKDYKESSPHLSVKKCVEKSKKWGNRLIISHLCPAYTDDEIMNEAGIGDKWEIAEERKEYVL